MPPPTALLPRVVRLVAKMASLRRTQSLSIFRFKISKADGLMSATSTKMWMKGLLTRELGYYKNECCPAELSIFPRNRRIGSVGKVYVAITSQDWNGKTAARRHYRVIYSNIKIYLLQPIREAIFRY